MMPELQKQLLFLAAITVSVVKKSIILMFLCGALTHKQGKMKNKKSKNKNLKQKLY